MAITNKRYLYKIYDYTGNFMTEWTDVITDPTFSWEINNGPGELTLKLARPFANFGEGVDVAFENKLEIYVQDKEAVQGKLIYSGRLNEIRPHFGKDGEWVEVQFLGYASTLNDQIARDRTAIDWYETVDPNVYKSINQAYVTLPNIYSDKGGSYVNSTVAEAFQPTVPNISGFQITLSGSVNNPEDVVVSLLNADQYSAQQRWTNQFYTVKPGNLLASGVLPGNKVPTNTGFTTVNINFPKTYTVTPNKSYYVAITGSGTSFASSNVNYYSSYFDGSVVWYSQQLTASGNYFIQANTGAGIPYINNFQKNSLFDTTAPLYSYVDPTLIAKDLVTNKYQGPLTFDLVNSPLTKQPVLYQFNRQTYKAALDRCVELAPPYWFYRINPDNTLQFLPRNDAVLDHTLILGQHISDASPIHSVNELVTRVVLYGGSDTGGSELIYVDDRDYLQQRYTLKEKLLRDSRVHLSSTAAQFTRDYLDFYGNPTTQMQVTVQDSNGDYAYGYDIESFKVGQRVLVVDPRADAAKNYWGTGDNINLDGDALDKFDTYVLAAPLQIMAITYQPDYCVLTLANEPVTAPHKIDDINQNLVQSQTGNSPVI